MPIVSTFGICLLATLLLGASPSPRPAIRVHQRAQFGGEESNYQPDAPKRREHPAVQQSDGYGNTIFVVRWLRVKQESASRASPRRRPSVLVLTAVLRSW